MRGKSEERGEREVWRNRGRGDRSGDRRWEEEKGIVEMGREAERKGEMESA